MAGTITAPQRMTLTNLTTSEKYEAQANPPEFEESIEVDYQRKKPVGAGYELLQYNTTGNLKYDLELSFIADSRSGGVTKLHQDRAFLLSLCYPDVAQTVASGAPPDVLFLWPGLVSITSKIMSLKFKHKFFQRTGISWHFTVKVALEENRTMRILSSDVRSKGAVR